MLLTPLYVTKTTVPQTTAAAAAASAPTCTPASLDAYYKQLEAWNACQYCAFYGYGARQLANGKYACDTSKPKAGAAAACNLVAPTAYCSPATVATDTSPVDAWTRHNPYAWGASVYDPKYGDYILWGTWDDAAGRPYLAKSAPYMLAGQSCE